jgi:hypothetical protein
MRLEIDNADGRYSAVVLATHIILDDLAKLVKSR